jgi:hypothetical protein
VKQVASLVGVVCAKRKRSPASVVCVYLSCSAHIGFALNGELIKSIDDLESVRENEVIEYLG